MSTVPFTSPLYAHGLGGGLGESMSHQVDMVPAIFSPRKAHQYGKILFVGLFLHWVGRGYWSFRQSRLFTANRLTEMKSQQQGFSVDTLREQLLLLRQDHHHDHNQNEQRRILVVGLIQSLDQLIENTAVILSLQELCTLYHHHHHPGGSVGAPNSNDNVVHVRIVYQRVGENADADAIDDVAVVTRLQSQLYQAGCQLVDLVSETLLFDKSEQGASYWQQRFPDMNRFERLAVLRSLQRQQIIMPPLVTTTVSSSSLLSSFNDSNYIDATTHDELHDGNDDYNVIVNFDADILQFPPLAALSQAIETAASANTNQIGGGGGRGAIVCANGYEQWTLPLFSPFDVYYDTFASIDTAGKWYYAEYVQAWYRILTFPQATLFFDIIDSSHASSSTFPFVLWPMQSCFGGMAVYDYDTWSNEMCDYDRHTIRLRVNSKHNDENHQQAEQWTVSPSYTIDGTISGDACEHVVFQQCLLAASQQREHQRQPVRSSRNNKELMIGIQPNLFIGRHADPSLLTFVLKTILVITSAMVVLAMVLRNRIGQRPLQLKQRILSLKR
jgi:hypothetical protein